MDFMHSNGRIKAYETIDKLQKDLSILTVITVLRSIEEQL